MRVARAEQLMASLLPTKAHDEPTVAILNQLADESAQSRPGKGRRARSIDEEELALYCAIVLSMEEITTLGLSEVCHSRARAGGRKPGITTQEVKGQTEKNKKDSLFVKPHHHAGGDRAD